MHDIRTFRARTMPEALAQVKRELGASAIILGTRSAPAGALGRLVGRDQVEITAAPSERPAPIRLRNGHPRPRPVGPVPSDRMSTGTAALEPLTENRTAMPSEPGYRLYAKLVQQGVGEHLAAQIIQAALAKTAPESRTDERAIERAVRARIAELVGEPAPAGLAGAPARLAVVGPAGAGKTTTLAKLAAHLALRSGRKVGLLTLDARRVGAAEALRGYAEVFGVPFEVARDEVQAAQAARRLGDAEHLLIDTPGAGGRDAAGVAALGPLLQALRPDEVHLVLPAYTARAAQVYLARAFAPLGVTRVALTHLDDAAGGGALLNVADRLPWPLSYLSFGENVPQDLQTAGGREVAELLLGASG